MAEKAPAPVTQQVAGMHGSSRLFASEESKRLLLALVLAAATLILYSPVNKFQFVNYDDDVYVTRNPHVPAGLSASNIKWAFKTGMAANWHPLTWISHMLDCQLFGLNPAGPHLVNVILHVLNTVLLFLLLHRATGYLWRSAMVAALFALHPLNVGSVAWIAERKNMLSTLFWLLALGAYGWYAARPSWRRYLPVGILFALGLMAKPMVITLPPMLLLLDYWPLRRVQSDAANRIPWRRMGWLFAEKIPLFILCAVAAAMTVIAQRGSLRTVSQFPLPVRLENALASCGAYIWKTFWPTNLAVFYPHPMHLTVFTPHPQFSVALWKVVLAGVMTVAVTVIALRKWRSRPYLIVGWLAYLLMLVPVIGIVQVGDQAMADRYAYLPLIGIFVMLVWTVAELAERWKVPALAMALLAAVVLVPLTLDSRVQLSYWHDSVTLFSHALDVTGENYLAEVKLAEGLTEMRDHDSALRHFEKLITVNPSDPIPYYLFGTYLQALNDMPNAMRYYGLAIQAGSALPIGDKGNVLAEVFNNLGVRLRDIDRSAEAEASFEDSIHLDPSGFRVYLNLGDLLQSEGKNEAAAVQFAKSVEIRPTADGYYLLARCLAKQGKIREAIAADRQAMTVERENLTIQTAARNYLAELEAHLGKSSR